MSDFKENVIEWCNGDDRISLTLHQEKYINKVKKLKASFPNEVDFIENEDGGIFAHLPLKALKLSIISSENKDFSRQIEALMKAREGNASRD